MREISQLIRRNHKYLQLLSAQYPTIQSVCTEIINLRAILNLPKGTEHFMSDLHGEYEAFTHIYNNCSGVVREKIDDLYADTLPLWERRELCTLIYYPKQKLEQAKRGAADLNHWYGVTLHRLIQVCKITASKYTRSKVRKARPEEFSYIIDELLHADYAESNQSLYYEKITESILALDNADAFITALATLIKRLAVDRLHIVGDIFDRGSRPDEIMDMLMEHYSVDIQWGNHDILWMGAAAGNEACIAAAVANSVAFGNLKLLEQGYGVNLRSLALFAESTYREGASFAPKIQGGGELEEKDRSLMALMYKAISIIQFKLEGQLLGRRPEYGMSDRRLLHRIDFDRGGIHLDGAFHPLTDPHLPTVGREDPYRLSEAEGRIVAELKGCFLGSERLQKHVRFLYSHGSMYLCFNHNLMFHGCIPMNGDGGFTQVDVAGTRAAGKGLMDLADATARTAYFGAGTARDNARDWMWYLWCGKDSPLFGRDKMTTFERAFVADKALWEEQKNPYYRHVQEEGHCVRILEEFGLSRMLCHIVNGHVPVRVSQGENPVKGGGKLIVIDGGFCKAYHRRTGIAGYTLIYNSYGMRLMAHSPFEDLHRAIEQNQDIHSVSNVFEILSQRMLVMDTDTGQRISEQIYDLSLLLSAYRQGIITEAAKKV